MGDSKAGNTNVAAYIDANSGETLLRHHRHDRLVVSEVAAPGALTLVVRIGEELEQVRLFHRSTKRAIVDVLKTTLGNIS